MISVIIPIYNPEDKLIKCLDSILNQSYKDLEIICVNDGSTDNSANILLEYAEIDERIIVINQTNQGVSAARNRGLEIASGEYLSFVDSDDELDSKMYETLIALLDNESETYDIAHCGYRRIRPDGTTVDINGTNQIIIHTREEALYNIISGTLFTGGLWNKLFRHKLFDNIRFMPDLKINEDVLVCFQAFSKSKFSVFYDKALYFYNENPKSTCSSTKELVKALDSVRVAKIIYKECNNTSLNTYAAKRYFNTLCAAYRAYLFDNLKTTKTQREKLSISIDVLIEQKIQISNKQKFNYFLMKVLPRLYRTLYKLYDSIRTPNWDVN